MKELLIIGAIFGLVLSSAVRAENDGLPAGSFDASRYESLWKDSPFAVATPVAVESAQYALVGAAQFDGVSYASVIDKQSQDHFVVTSATPSHGLTLIDLAHGTDAGSTFATLQKNGALLKLKLENDPATGGTGTAVSSSAAPPPPVVMNNNLPFRHPPHVRIFRAPVYVPSPPNISSSP
jgi:hypothetical protein